MKFKKSSILLFVLLLLSVTLVSSQSNGFKEVQLTNTASDNRYASYNKDGTLILFESNRDGYWQIYTMTIDGDRQKRLFKSRHNDRRPTWHPYKNMILFESDRNNSGTSELYTYNLETNKVKRVPIPIIGNKYFGEFAPNGVEIVFCFEDKPGDIDIYSIHKKGKLLRKLVDNKNINLYPKLNSRGGSILYFTDKNVEKDTNVILSYGIYSEDRKRLSYFKDHSEYADWPNKKNRIVYSAIIDGNTSEIYTMDIDGTSKKRITFNDSNDILPHWSPNDINILITGERNGNEQICKVLLKEPL